MAGCPLPHQSVGIREETLESGNLLSGTKTCCYTIFSRPIDCDIYSEYAEIMDSKEDLDLQTAIANSIDDVSIMRERYFMYIYRLYMNE